MNIPKDLRIHLNKLSKEVLGTSSKWQKIMMNGERRENTYVYPTLEEVQASLEQRAIEKAEEAKKKAEEAAAKAITMSTPTVQETPNG